MARARTTLGGYLTDKCILRGGDTAHNLLMGGTIGVGTPHNIERVKVGTLLAGWVAGWLAGWLSQ